MLPRLRSGTRFSRDEILAHQKALRAGPVNTTGLPALPAELLLEVTSHYPLVDVPKFTRNVYPAEYLDRAAALQSLSQVCRSLRNAFLPHLWQRIEACASPRISGSKSRRWGYPRLPWERDLAVELVRQLEVVTIRNPALGQYIKIVNVLITDHSCGTIMPELARCLALFPNLHTIQILGASYSFTHAKKAFFGKCFPSVRIVVVHANARPILATFPNAQYLTVSGFESAKSDAFEILLKHCHHLKILRGFSNVNYDSFMDGRFINRLCKSFPEMRTIVLDTDNDTLTDTVVTQFAMLPQLANFEISISANRGSLFPENILKIIEASKKVLREGPDVDSTQKRVHLVYRDGTEQVEVV